MTASPAGTQPAPAAPVHVTPIPSVLRAIISVCETVGFIVGAVLALMNNGQDFKHAIAAALLAFVAHGVNHNAGGSPV